VPETKTMSRENIRHIRAEGEKVHQSLKEELYLNHAGLKNKTDITAILKSYQDLLEPEVFFSLREAGADTEEEKNGIKLMLSFLAETILLSKTSQIRDSILYLEASSIFSVGKNKIPFRSSRAALLKKSKKQETREIQEKREAVLSKLNQLYLRQYAYKQKDSHDLGFSSYLHIYEATEGLNTSELVEKAKEFIRDTEYISRDLLRWFLLKRMDIKLKDVNLNDMFYLINSFELGSLPKMNPHSTAKALLAETGLNPQAKIIFDSEKRKGHITGSRCYASNPGVEILISTNTQGGIWDYESFLGSFGESLSYGYTKRDEHFEYKYLREKSFVGLFSELFKNLVFEPGWIKKHFRLDAENDFLKFLYLRRLMLERILSAKLIYEAALYQGQENKTEIYKEIMETATHVKANKHDYLIDIEPHLSSADSFKATILEPQLRTYLIDNFDEQWWREKEAGEFLVNIWKTGGRTSVNNISEKYGFGDTNISTHTKIFEEVLG
jgi:hypothetical protein